MAVSSAGEYRPGAPAVTTAKPRPFSKAARMRARSAAPAWRNASDAHRSVTGCDSRFQPRRSLSSAASVVSDRDWYHDSGRSIVLARQARRSQIVSVIRETPHWEVGRSGTVSRTDHDVLSPFGSADLLTIVGRNSA